MNTQKQNNRSGQWAVITGASSGIGYELAKIFAQNKFNLLVVAESPEIIEAGNAFRQFGTEVQTVQADLSNYEGVEEVYAKIKNLGQPIDSIVLNAGIGLSGEFLSTDLEAELNIIRLNIISLVHLTKRVLPDLVEADHGRIMFTSSIAADLPGPYLSVYAGSKAFVQSFAEALNKELEETGVSVTALQPGPTDTHFFARADMEDTKAGESKKDDPARVAMDGFKAMMAGKDHIVAGSLKNKVQDTIAKFVSEKTAATLHSQQTKPNTLK